MIQILSKSNLCELISLKYLLSYANQNCYIINLRVKYIFNLDEFIFNENEPTLI